MKRVNFVLNISLADVSVSMLHYSAEKKTFAKKAMSYNDLRLCLVLQGSALWQIDGIDYTVNSGDLVFLNPLQHRYFKEYDTSGFTLRVINLSLKALAGTDFLRFLREMAAQKTFFFRDSELLSTVQKLTEEFENRENGCEIMLSALFSELLVTAQRLCRYENRSTVKSDPLMAEITAYLDANITEPLDLASIAQKHHLTISALSRRFARYNGIHYKKYIRNKRISLAVNLMDSGEMNITQIALECGFSSVSGFYDAFKKVTGFAPGSVKNTL